jgi:transposase InsO family protein
MPTARGWDDVTKDWIRAQEDCPEIGLIFKFLRKELPKPQTSEHLATTKYRQLEKKAKYFYIREDGLLCNKCELSNGIRGRMEYDTIAVPISKRENLLTTFHGHSHIGINKTYRLLRERFFWNSIKSNVKNYINGCLTCRSRKDPRPSLAGKLKPFLHLNNRPWDTATMDIYGELPETKEGYKYLLVIVDHFSKWPEAIPLKDKKAETIANAILNEFLPRHSIPRKILSDNEATLIDKSVDQLWKLLGIKRKTSSVYHPQTNTAAKRFNRFLGDSIYATLGTKQTEWNNEIGTILMAYRMSIHPTTGESPYFLQHGTDPVIPEDIIFAIQGTTELMDHNTFAQKKFELMREIFQRTRERLHEFAIKEKLNADGKRTDSKNFELGRKVMVYHQETRRIGESTKLESRYSGPYRVLEVLSEGKAYRLWHPRTDHEWIINEDRIRPFDPWEGYNRGTADADLEFWKRWLQRAEKGNDEEKLLNTPGATIDDTAELQPLDLHALAEQQRVWSAAESVKQRSEEEEEEMRRTLKERYETICQLSSKARKPKPSKGYDYAQDWSGEWRLYNTEKPNYDVVRIIDRRFNNHLNEWTWLVQWKGDWLPTWENIGMFQEAAASGLSLVWREYERNHPYPKMDRRPAIRGVNRRHR